jgi:hypothetical protein
MIVQILQRTPIWVWPLFAALLYLGYTQSKTRSVSKQRLFALPLAMVGLSLYSLFTTFGPNGIGFAAWLAGGVLALLLNQVLKRPKEVRYISATRVFSLRGSWSPLALIMAIFVTRYTVAVLTAIDASLRAANAFVGCAGLAYGFLSGLFLARALHAARAAKAAH